MADYSVILQALFVDVSALGYEVKYPAKKFTPPDSGPWLELSVSPNEGYAEGLNSNTEVKQGIIQINVANRPNTSPVTLMSAVESVISQFPQGHVLTSFARVQKKPYVGGLLEMDDRVMYPITIPYSE